MNRHERNWLTVLNHAAPLFSTCARRQYMAVILATNNRVCGIGYNGAPPGVTHCTDGGCPRATSNSPHGSAYTNCVAQHAEAGALLWTDPTMRAGGTLIVNGPPCYDCAKLIASSGLKRVVCLDDPAYGETFTQVRGLFDAAGITLEVAP